MNDAEFMERASSLVLNYMISKNEMEHDSTTDYDLRAYLDNLLKLADEYNKKRGMSMQEFMDALSNVHTELKAITMNDGDFYVADEIGIGKGIAYLYRDEKLIGGICPENVDIIKEVV